MYGRRLADVVVPIALAVKRGQLAHELWHYKYDADATVRRRLEFRLAAVLWPGNCVSGTVPVRQAGAADSLLAQGSDRNTTARSASSMFFFPERTVVLAPCDQPRDRHLGASAGIAIGPLAELRRLRAVERHASREALEEAAMSRVFSARTATT
jgi:hypothetical protein